MEKEIYAYELILINLDAPNVQIACESCAMLRKNSKNILSRAKGRMDKVERLMEVHLLERFTNIADAYIWGN